MKRQSLLLIALIIIALAACQREAPKVITKRIQYDVPIKANSDVFDWWVNNIEGSDREDLVNSILDAALAGKYQAYDYFYDSLSIEEVKNVGIDTLFMTLNRDVEPYDEYDTLVVKKYEARDIAKIRFLEEWFWNEEGSIDKKVVGMAPVLVKSYGDEYFNQVLFWIFFDERYPTDLK